jgi:hypothetical protein
MTSDVIAWTPPQADDHGMNTTRTITETPTTTASSVDERRLRWVLRANATTSVLVGSVALVAPSWLDDVLGTGHPGWVRAVGLVLLVIAVEVLLVARADRAGLISGTRLVVGADVAWVAATILTIALGWYGDGGAVVMGIAAIGVADFAIAQHVLRRRAA